MLGSKSGGRALSATMLGKPGLQLNARVTIWGTHYSNYWSEWDHLETSQSRGIQIFWHSAQDLGNFKVFWSIEDIKGWRYRVTLGFNEMLGWQLLWTPKLPSIMASKLSNVFINWAMWSYLWWGPSWSSAVLKKLHFWHEKKKKTNLKQFVFIFLVWGVLPQTKLFWQTNIVVRFFHWLVSKS